MFSKVKDSRLATRFSLGNAHRAAAAYTRQHNETPLIAGVEDDLYILAIAGGYVRAVF